MKPTPCPSRLKELIILANLEPGSEARKNLQAVASAFRAKRHGQKPPSIVQFENRITIHISVADGTISAVYDDLAQTLQQIEATGSRIDLIRECPICSEIFWAGRSDSEACHRHAARWRKRKQRAKNKAKAEQRKKARERRAKSQAEKPIKLSNLSPTALAIINAVMNRDRVFWKIDQSAAWELKSAGVRPPTRAIVRKCCQMLVNRGYLTYHPHVTDDPDELDPGEPYEPPDPLDDRYAPTQKLINRVTGVYRKARGEETKNPPTH